MAVLEVGSGGTYATLPAAFAAVTSGNNDIIRLVSDINLDGPVDMNAKNSWQLDFNGFTATRTTAGDPNGTDGLFLWDCNDVRIYGPGLLTTAANHRSGGYGSGIGYGPDCAYVLIENMEISFFTQGGISGYIGLAPKWGRAFQGFEYVWINNVHSHDHDPTGSFGSISGEDGSCISLWVPYNAPNRSEPAWWQQKINAELNPTPPPGRAWADCMALITNCDLENYTAPGNNVDSDSNALIFDEWIDNFSSGWYGQASRSHSYPRIRPNGWGLICNNLARNTEGGAWRFFNNAEPGYAQRHVVAFNTSDNVGQRPYNPGSPTRNFPAVSATTSIATQGSVGETYHGMLISSNSTVNSGNAGGEQWVLSQSGTMANSWEANHQHNMTDTGSPGSPGIHQVVGDPLFDANYVPQGGSPLLGAGSPTWVPLYDRNGNLRNQSTPTIGAIEGAPTGPQAPVASFSYTPSGLTVDFVDTSSNTPTSWLWNFGDGNTDTVQNPQHTYGSDGVYTVTLTATNAAGSDQTSQQINVFVPAAGSVEVVSVTDLYIPYATPTVWDITVPTVADGDVLYILGTTRTPNDTQAGARVLGDVSTISFVEHYSAFTLGEWHSEGFGIYKTMTAAESGTTVTIPKTVANEPLSGQLYVFRNVDTFDTAQTKGGVNTIGVIGAPPVPGAAEAGDMLVSAWHIQNLTPANNATRGIDQLHPDGGTWYHIGHSAWEPLAASIPETDVNSLEYGPPTTTNYHSAAFMIRSTYEPPDPPAPGPTITGTAVLLT